MNFESFSNLAAQFPLHQAQAFSQQNWRRKFYPANQGTLCAGLTYFWLDEKLGSGVPLRQLDIPSATLLAHLAALQTQSYYPDFPKDFVLRESDLHLLIQKYGTGDWQALQQHVREKHQGDFVLFDLSRRFYYDTASIVRCMEPPGALSCLKALPAGSVALFVLRYLRDTRPAGHRIAYYLDPEHRHHFFDPNAGEIIEPTDTVFHQWLNAFLTHADYRKFAPSNKDPFLTLYLLENIVPRPIAPEVDSIPPPNSAARDCATRG